MQHLLRFFLFLEITEKAGHLYGFGAVAGNAPATCTVYSRSRGYHNTDGEAHFFFFHKDYCVEVHEITDFAICEAVILNMDLDVTSERIGIGINAVSYGRRASATLWYRIRKCVQYLNQSVANVHLVALSGNLFGDYRLDFFCCHNYI